MLAAEPSSDTSKRINRELPARRPHLLTALLCRAPFVPMVEPADLGNVYYSSQCRRVDGA